MLRGYVENIKLLPRRTTGVRVTKLSGIYLPYIALNSRDVNSIGSWLEKVVFGALRAVIDLTITYERTLLLVQIPNSLKVENNLNSKMFNVPKSFAWLEYNETTPFFIKI